MERALVCTQHGTESVADLLCGRRIGGGVRHGVLRGGGGAQRQQPLQGGVPPRQHLLRATKCLAICAQLRKRRPTEDASFPSG